MKLQAFFKAVTAHSIAAVQRWGYMDRGVTKATWNQVLSEEVGKLARACNKLSLATDAEVRTQWEQEARHRLITIASITARFYSALEDLPDADRGNTTDNVNPEAAQ